MRIAICDDDERIRGQLYKLVKSYFETQNLDLPDIVCFANGEAMLKDEGELDILFLDIEMPGKSGIYIGRDIKEKNQEVIIFIVTSYPEYLDEAMGIHVFRYLTKPIEKLRLYRNLREALQIYYNNSQKILIETKTGGYTLRAADILCVEAADRKVLIYTVKRLEPYESIYNMQYWEEHLNSKCFFRTHRSYLVNMEHISSFDHSIIQLSGSEICPYLTRRKYTEFKKAYMSYLGSTR